MMTSEEFKKGWLNFIHCINFKDSYLNAEAIRFMNEAPPEIIKSLIYFNTRKKSFS